MDRMDPITHQDKTFNVGDVVRCFEDGFGDATIVNFEQAINGSLVAVLAHPYAFVRKEFPSILTGYEKFSVGIEQLYKYYPVVKKGYTT